MAKKASKTKAEAATVEVANITGHELSNVAKLGGWAPPMGPMGDGDWISRFELPSVREEPLAYGTGRRTTLKEHRALVLTSYPKGGESEVERLVNVVTKDYTLVRHEEVLDLVRDTVRTMPDFGTPQMGVALSSGGAKMRAEVVFPDVALAVAKGDQIAPRITIFNSYDGSWALRGLIGAFRLLCSNGMAVGKVALQYRQEHHQADNTDRLRSVISRGVDMVRNEVGLWESWVDHVTTQSEYEHVVETLPLTKTEVKEIGETVEVSSGVKVEDLKIKSLSYWLLFNIVTQYVTHRVQSEARRVRIEAAMTKAFGR